MCRLSFLTKPALYGHGKVELRQKRNLRSTSDTSLTALHISVSTMNLDCNKRPSPNRSSRGMERVPKDSRRLHKALQNDDVNISSSKRRREHNLVLICEHEAPLQRHMRPDSQIFATSSRAESRTPDSARARKIEAI
jgi:hypothetical protein